MFHTFRKLPYKIKACEGIFLRIGEMVELWFFIKVNNLVLQALRASV